jgi:hypothetical protein
VALEGGSTWSELGHIFLELDQSHAGKLILLHSKELKDPLVVFLIGIDGHKEHFSFVFLKLNNSLGDQPFTIITIMIKIIKIVNTIKI